MERCVHLGGGKKPRKKKYSFILKNAPCNFEILCFGEKYFCCLSSDFVLIDAFHPWRVSTAFSLLFYFWFCCCLLWENRYFNSWKPYLKPSKINREESNSKMTAEELRRIIEKKKKKKIINCDIHNDTRFNN